MMFALLPVLALVTSQPHAAQARLAEALGDADSVDAVRADPAHHTVTFSIDRAGEAYEIVARIRPEGQIVQLAIRDRGRGQVGLGPLSWLVDVAAQTAAFVRLEVQPDGQVTLVTSDGDLYRAMPGGGDGNDAPRARWAATWDR